MDRMPPKSPAHPDVIRITAAELDALKVDPAQIARIAAATPPLKVAS